MTPKPTVLEVGATVHLNGQEYKIKQAINRGGSAELYQIFRNGINYALKLFFPFYYIENRSINEQSFLDLINMQENENKILRSLSHTNIVRIFDAGQYSATASQIKSLGLSDWVRARNLPFIIEEFIDGTNIQEAFHNKIISKENVCDVLVGICSAIEHAHSSKYMHSDLTVNNVLIRYNSIVPVLIDFGLSKNLNILSNHHDGSGRSHITRMLVDWGRRPMLPENDPFLEILDKKEGTTEEILEYVFPTWDIWQFGKLLATLHQHIEPLLDRSGKNYLFRLESELSDWNKAKKWNASDLKERVARLSPTRYSILGVPELAPATPSVRVIMVPPDIGVPVTPRIQAILGNRSFRRLAYINQLTLIPTLYPGAEHKRFLHSIHTYDIGRKLIENLYHNSVFRLNFSESDTIKLLAIILLHDINHFPLLHVLQEADVPGIRDINLIKMFCDGKITGEKSRREPSIENLLSEIGVSLDIFENILFKTHNQLDDPVSQIISSIVNSGADVDKMSYLFLDSYFSGIRFGQGIDLAGLLKSATICQTQGGKFHLGFNDRGFQSVESLVLTRSWSFRSIYWHHTNRALMAMVTDVAHKLFRAMPFEKYVSETMWKNDFEAVVYLDAKYKSIFKTPSILNDFVRDRSRIFKRLYTISSGAANTNDRILFKELKKLNYSQLVNVRKLIAGELIKINNIKEKIKIVVDEHCVLIDLPGREITSGGAVYLVNEGTKKVELFEDISPAYQAAQKNYVYLSERVRFFISPDIYKLLPDEYRDDGREAIYKILNNCINLISANSPNHVT